MADISLLKGRVQEMPTSVPLRLAQIRDSALSRRMKTQEKLRVWEMLITLQD